MFIRLFTGVGGIAGGCGVVLGALLAHLPSGRVDAAGRDALGTVSLYLLVHGLLLLSVASWLRAAPDAAALRAAGMLIVIGIICFCGGLSASILAGMEPAGAAAPLGGVAFIAGWLLLGVYGAMSGCMR